MEDRNVRRGDIYHADLDPVFGSEQGGYRPVLVIQNNIGNKYSPTVIVAAITSKEKMKLPTHIAVPEMEGLEKDSVVLLEQLRTLDKRRLENYVCTLDRTEMEKKKMELWFSDYHTEKVKLSVKVQKQLFEQQTDFQRIDVFE